MVACKRFKKIANYKTISQVPVTYRRWSFMRDSKCTALTEKRLGFFSVVAYGRYSLMRGGHSWRFDCISKKTQEHVIHVELKNKKIYILYNNTDLITCLHKKECHSIRLQPPTKLNVSVLCLQLIMTRHLLVFLW